MENLISFVQNQLDASWNSHDINRVLEAFDDNATLTFSPPLPGVPPTSRGKEEIRQLVETLLPGFHVESRNFKVEGDRVHWSSELRSEMFRNAGVDSVECNTTATIRNNKVVSLMPSVTEESITKLQAASARTTSQGGKQQARDTSRPSTR